ncbi:MAG: hypothetical protein QNJ05_04605 [Woeseiaceae bacterium]|nr:hypothetical protein [Woeseiaceae bacterium]
MAESKEDGSDLSDSERRILDAINARQIADFSSLPDDERKVDADFLQRLISGGFDDFGAVCSPLRIRGARVTGRLLPPAGVDGETRIAVQFWDCDFDSPIDFSAASFLVLRFVDCRLPAFIGASLHVSADLDFSGSHIAGASDLKSELSRVDSAAVHLNNARIGGKLDFSATDVSRFQALHTVRLDGAHIDGDVSFSGALLTCSDEAALSARSVTVGGNFELTPEAGHRFEATGEVVLGAAQITGDLDCRGARLINPDGRALHCEDLKVESVFLSLHPKSEQVFEASGRLNFLTAIIGGSFFMTNARLKPGPDYDGLLTKGGPIAINLQQARISNAIALRHIRALDPDRPSTPDIEGTEPVRGWFLLTGTMMNAIIDNVETAWPAAGFLDLEGATYERIRHFGDGDMAPIRINWLRRQYPNGKPCPNTIRSQPYEQLARVLRQHGQAREANAIAVEKIRMRLKSRVDKRWARVFPSLLMLISQHGYSSSRAIASFALLVAAGTLLYATAIFGFQQPFLPNDYLPEPVVYQFAFGLFQQSVEEGCRGLDVVQFALDRALPVIDFSQDARCRFTPEGPGRSIWLFLHSLYVTCGAALSAVVILTLTGILRDD